MRFSDWGLTPIGVAVFCPSSVGGDPPMHPGFYYSPLTQRWRPAYFVGDTEEDGAAAAFSSHGSPLLVIIGGTVLPNPYVPWAAAFASSVMGRRL